MRGKDAGAFILRIFIGIAFLIHGALKFQGELEIQQAGLKASVYLAF